VSPAHPRLGDGSNRIEFRHVWFTYQKLTPEQHAAVDKASRSHASNAELAALKDIDWILKDVSFTVEPGHTVGEGDLNAVFGATALARERTADVTVTFVSDPTSGTTSTQTAKLCGEGVHTGARVLVTQGGVPMPKVHEIELKRLGGGWFGFAKEVDEVKNALLQTLTATPGTACASFQFHKEYGAVTDAEQLVPGVYQLKVEAIVAGKEVRKKTFFQVGTCGFNGTIVVDF
jgi:hypothetical protein